MSYIVPNSTIKIFRLDDNDIPIPFDPNYENTVFFPDVASQAAYMDAYNPLIIQNNSYQRVNLGHIRVSVGVNDNNIASLYNASYMAFRNDSFENKWFYAFVDAVEYVNNNTVSMYYHIDVIQTYMFDFSFNQCLIEREHTVTDNIGEHTYPEGLETGEYRSYPSACYLVDENSPDGLAYMYNRFEYRACIILACALDNNDLDKYSYGISIPGIAAETGKYYSGVRYYAYKMYGGGETQGIYQFNFAGNWSYGDRIQFNTSNIFITAEAATNDDTLAEYIKDAINTGGAGNGIYFAVHSDFGVITVYETTGHFGAGMPDVSTTSATGQIYSYVIQEGSSGDEYGDINKLNAALAKINEKAKTDAIVGMFMMPVEFYPKTQNELTNGVQPLDFRVYCPTTIDYYTPRNKKLFCYPYNILYETNNNGSYAEYRFENFIRQSDDKGTYTRFKIWGNISMNPGMYCAPAFYNGNALATGATDDEVIVTGFPMCSFNIDSYKAWLAQNAGTIAAMTSDILGDWASSFANAGLVASGILSSKNKTRDTMQVINQFDSALDKTGYAIGKVYDHSRRPPQISGQNNANLAYQAGQMTFSFYNKQIKEEYARIIDCYFDMYGYKTNRVGTPILNARPRYSYVKTIGCSIEGAIPGDFKREIESIFDKGIRFWNASATFGNFDPTVNPNGAVT